MDEMKKLPYVVLYYTKIDKTQLLPLDIWENLRKQDKAFFKSVGIIYLGVL
jgi:hypothetical protein